MALFPSIITITGLVVVSLGPYQHRQRIINALTEVEWYDSYTLEITDVIDIPDSSISKMNDDTLNIFVIRKAQGLLKRGLIEQCHTFLSGPAVRAKSTEVRFIRALTLLLRNRQMLSRGVIVELRNKFRDSEHVEVICAMLFAQRGLYEDSQNASVRALGLNEQNARAHLVLSYTMYRLGNLAGALEHVNRSLMINPLTTLFSSPAGYELRGDILRRLGKLDESIPMYIAALRVGAQEAEIVVSLHDAYRRMGMVDASRVLLEKLDAVASPKHKDVKINLRLQNFLDKGELVKAEEMMNSTDAKIWPLLRGIVADRLEDHRLAKKHYAKAKVEGDPRAAIALALMEIEQAITPEAKESLHQRFLRDHKYEHYVLAASYSLIDGYDTAITLIEKLIADAGKNDVRLVEFERCRARYSRSQPFTREYGNEIGLSY